MEKRKKVSEPISGKDTESVRDELMEKAKKLYCDLQDSYKGLSKSARSQHVKAMLNDFAEEAGRDCKELESVLSKESRTSMETAERSLGMFRQLLSAKDANLTEEEKALIDALKLSDNLRNVFSILSKEYKDSKIRNFFEMLSKHETYRENELEQLYEEIIVKGEW
ncbi:MAG: hypothetical protein ACP5UZ_08630 [Thermoplasmata archaeon]